MTNLPKISIVTPSYNQGQFLEQTICSVLDQNYPNLEYVIIDGGSTDNSVEIIKKYSSRLAYWVSEPDKGHANGLNKGFSKTSGEIMAWLNSDDKYLPWTFEVVAEVFTAFPDVNWIVGTNAWWDKNGRLMTARSVYKNIYDYLLGNFKWIQQESVFWRRGLWEKAGGKINEEYKNMVDGELWCKFFLIDKLYHMNCILSGYRDHETNYSKFTMDNVYFEINRAIGWLRQNSSAEVLNNYNKFKKIKLLNDKLKLKYFPFEGILRRFFFKKLYDDIAYDRIVYNNKTWVKTKERFSVVSDKYFQ